MTRLWFNGKKVLTWDDKVKEVPWRYSQEYSILLAKKWKREEEREMRYFAGILNDYHKKQEELYGEEDSWEDFPEDEVIENMEDEYLSQEEEDEYDDDGMAVMIAHMMYRDDGYYD